MSIPGIGQLAGITSTINNLIDPLDQAKDVVLDKAEQGANVVASEVAEITHTALRSDARELTGQERAIAEEYFGDTIDLDRVKVNESSVLSSLSQYDPGNENARPFVLGNTINFPDGFDLDSPKDRGTFIHELAHVWQYQNTKGIGVQLEGATLARDSSNYDIDTDQLDDVDNFDSFNIEQQAEVVQGYYLLQTHAELTEQRDALVNGPLPVASSELTSALEDIDKDIAEVEDKGAFQDLTAAGITADDLEPFIDRIQGTNNEIRAEVFEATDEIISSGFSDREIIEGGFEIGREIGEAGLEAGANVVTDGISAADEFVDDVGDLVSGRWSPFGR